ncbi:MAG TPA: hypothetical protein VL944_03440 [Candidatus Acidoferrum sp.]|nr:hypothetical protein [Candidatus Acidoferrum sp.]
MAHTFRPSSALTPEISQIDVESSRRFSVTTENFKVGFDVDAREKVTITIEMRPPIMISWVLSPSESDAIPKVTRSPAEASKPFGIQILPEPRVESDEDKVNRLVCLELSKRVISEAIAQAAAPSSNVDQAVLHLVAVRLESMLKLVNPQLKSLKEAFLEDDKFRRSIDGLDKGVFNSFKLEF